MSLLMFERIKQGCVYCSQHVNNSIVYPLCDNCLLVIHWSFVMQSPLLIIICITPTVCNTVFQINCFLYTIVTVPYGNKSVFNSNTKHTVKLQLIWNFWNTMETIHVSVRNVVHVELTTKPLCATQLKFLFQTPWLTTSVAALDSPTELC